MNIRCRRIPLCDLPAGHEGNHEANLIDGPAVTEAREIASANKVFIVMDYAPEGEIRGVFDTREAADDFVNRYDGEVEEHTIVRTQA